MKKQQSSAGGVNLAAVAGFGEAQGKKRGGGNIPWWSTPKNGVEKIRLLPIPPGMDGNPFRTCHIHYGFKSRERGFLCPKEMGVSDNCPACDYAWMLYKAAEEAGSENARKAALKLLPRQRYYSAIVVRGKENEGPKVWGYPKTIFEKLLSKMIDPETGYGDYLNPETGLDIKVSFSVGDGASYPKASIEFFTKASVLMADPEAAAALIEAFPLDAMNNLMPEISVEDVVEIVNGHHSEASDGGDDEIKTNYGSDMTAEVNRLRDENV